MPISENYELPSNNEVRSTNLPLNQNPTSIYYIHPSNANCSQLVSVKYIKIGFTNWKRSMILTLSAKNKLGFVTKDILEPSANTDEHTTWK